MSSDSRPWKTPDPLAKAAHDAKERSAYKALKQVEDELHASTGDWGMVFRDPRYKEAFNGWRSLYNSCRNCGSADTRIENHDLMWHDGDIICNSCDCYVRGFDAG